MHQPSDNHSIKKSSALRFLYSLFTIVIGLLFISPEVAATDKIKKNWPHLKRACELEDSAQCEQTGDLDGDGLPDRVLVVQSLKAVSFGATGLLLISTSAAPLLLGAGDSVALPQRDFELNASNTLVWTDSPPGKALPQDLSFIRRVWVGGSKPTQDPPLCARAMKLGHDVIILGTEDTAFAIYLHKGQWSITDCGY